MACATVCVGVCTIVYVVRWYEQERQPYELIDHRSFASSSQRGGVYRPGNAIPMVHLGGPMGNALHLRGGAGGEDGNLRCEEELRQVQELPEEEEAEAREMEKHHKLRMMKKEEMAMAANADNTNTETSLDSDDPHERNLIKSRFHSQAKTLHKDLISDNKKPAASSTTSAPYGITVGGGAGGGVGSLGRRMLAYRRTQEGTYEGVPGTDPDDPEDSKITATEEESHAGDRRGSRRSRNEAPPDYTAATAGDFITFHKGDGLSRTSPVLSSDLRVKLDAGKDRKFTSFGGGSGSKSGDGSEPKYANDPSERDPLLILADVHKTTSDASEDKPDSMDTPKGRTNRPGNVYVNPAQVKRSAPPKLSSFGTPVVTSTPKGRASANDSSGETDQDPWILNNMSDIAEDPREDDQSVVSGSGRSGKSNSMYGSSEIFESGEYRAMGPSGLADFYDGLLDSDVEVPPLDAEDGGLLSDGGLHSPLGFPAPRAGDKGKVNDDIKLIPGALKSPGAHVGHQIGASTRPRPYSSFIYRPSLPLSPVTPKTTTKTGSTAQGQTPSTSTPSSGNTQAEESPPLPPLPPYPSVGGAIASIDDDSQSASSAADTSVFQFPPPPSLCPPESSNGNGGARGVGGEYVQIKVPRANSSKPDQSASGPQGGGRGRGGVGRGGRKLFGGGT
ncbi:hypothetical protein PoB_000231300 [Plakobranchus ocellatus]|uniref:Uncharacterized protein n=1 Tax=Plakobranchus ocellatus TaxID=259542 RepID=A0AAV3Y022_9GAST|nr:hypothetical protein PoB_000231300 [Plakobranchus ocellatus]